MNYQKHYSALIERAKTRTLLKDIYTEYHHIIPKCMGGTNDKPNLIKLTAEEHYVAHQLLVKIYPKESGLIYAVNMMSGNKIGKRNNKSFGWIRRKNAEIARKTQLGRKHSKETRLKMSNAHKGKIVSEETRIKLRKPRNYTDKIKQKISNTHKGKIVSEETRLKISNANKGRLMSKEWKNNISKALKGKKWEVVICPYCNKSGGKPLMTRYHFNNCKFKEI